ncbi:MAG TPA: TetR family transcriptional regulator [Pseudomonas sp.]|nr:TetR family transcriptional regulator [Pseudomonas sp.]
MRRTKEEAEQTRCALLAAAEQLFLEQGVAHTTLEQIARAAGVTRGALYWHFANKADLFHAMLEQVRLPPEQLAGNLSCCGDLDPRQALRQLCVQAIVSLAQNPQKRRIFTILLYRCEFTDDLRHAQERHEAFIAQIIALFEQLFAQAECQGHLQPGQTPRLAALALHALILGMFSDWLRNERLFDPERDAPQMIDALLRGLLRD